MGHFQKKMWFHGDDYIWTHVRNDKPRVMVDLIRNEMRMQRWAIGKPAWYETKDIDVITFKDMISHKMQLNLENIKFYLTTPSKYRLTDELSPEISNENLPK